MRDRTRTLAYLHNPDLRLSLPSTTFAVLRSSHESDNRANSTVVEGSRYRVKGKRGRGGEEGGGGGGGGPEGQRWSVESDTYLGSRLSDLVIGLPQMRLSGESDNASPVSHRLRCVIRSSMRLTEPPCLRPFRICRTAGIRSLGTRPSSLA